MFSPVTYFEGKNPSPCFIDALACVVDAFPFVKYKLYITIVHSQSPAFTTTCIVQHTSSIHIIEFICYQHPMQTMSYKPG